MVRRLIALAVIVFFGLSAALALEPKKGEAKPAHSPEKKAVAAKPAAPPVSPNVQRVNGLREELKKAQAKQAAAQAELGTVQGEAIKIKHRLAVAEGNAAACRRNIEDLEKKLVEAMARAEQENKEKFVRERADADARRMADLSKKVAELEHEVRALKGRLESGARKAAPPPAKHR